MDWNDLRYLLAVHRTGSLAAAAKQLGVTKATASRRLAALEEALGARLMERKPSGLSLTTVGEEAVRVAERMEREAIDLGGRVASASDRTPNGKVRVTAPPWLADRFLIPALPQLTQRYPDLEVELLNSNQMLNLAQHEADLAIRNVRPSQQSLLTKLLIPLGGSVYGSKLYLERRGVPASRAELREHDVLVYAGLGGMPGFEWLKDEEHGGRIVFRANDPVALLSAASAGLGLGAIPCLLGDTSDALVRVPSLGFHRCDMFLVMHEQNRNVPRIRVVAEFVSEMMIANRALIDGGRVE